MPKPRRPDMFLGAASYPGGPLQTPKKCIELVNQLLLSHWSFVVNHGEDSGGSPYINIEAVRDNQMLYITWHTRETGTYRLFSCLHNKRDVSLKKVMEVVTQ